MTDCLWIGTRKGLLQYRYDGSGWVCSREVFSAMPISYAIHDARTGTLWAALDHGHWGRKLHRSDDGGATWREVVAPSYPEGATRPDGQPATNSYIWLVQPGGADEPNRLYIGTEPGGLFVSDDGGESFRLVEGLWNHPSRQKFWFGGGRDHPGVCSLVVDPRDSRHLYAGVSVGGVFESRDGGATWEGRNKGLVAHYLPDPYSEYGHDPHFLTASPSNPDVLWQQNHCGVFRSVDGGQTWQDISAGDKSVYFGFPIAPDPHDERVAWVVPATSDESRVPLERALYVARTDDGGQTWQKFRKGLPQSNCYDIVFRHALDVSGERLAFGTTSGNLYLSDDRGESWQCIAHHLAMVYSVRFSTV